MAQSGSQNCIYKKMNGLDWMFQFVKMEKPRWELKEENLEAFSQLRQGGVDTKEVGTMVHQWAGDQIFPLAGSTRPGRGPPCHPTRCSLQFSSNFLTYSNHGVSDLHFFLFVSCFSKTMRSPGALTRPQPSMTALPAEIQINQRSRKRSQSGGNHSAALIWWKLIQIRARSN